MMDSSRCIEEPCPLELAPSSSELQASQPLSSSLLGGSILHSWETLFLWQGASSWEQLELESCLAPSEPSSSVHLNMLKSNDRRVRAGISSTFTRALQAHIQGHVESWDSTSSRSTVGEDIQRCWTLRWVSSQPQARQPCLPTGASGLLKSWRTLPKQRLQM